MSQTLAILLKRASEAEWIARKRADDEKLQRTSAEAALAHLTAEKDSLQTQLSIARENLVFARTTHTQSHYRISQPQPSHVTATGSWVRSSASPPTERDAQQGWYPSPLTERERQPPLPEHQDARPQLGHKNQPEQIQGPGTGARHKLGNETDEDKNSLIGNSEEEPLSDDVSPTTISCLVPRSTSQF